MATTRNRRSNPGRNGSKRRRRRFRWAIVLLLILAFLFLTATGVAAAFLYDTLQNLPRITNFQFQPAQTSFILDRDGNVITRVPATENRIVVEMKSIPTHVQEAFISIEDVRFQNHFGVDLLGIARALINDITGGPLQGASTITQQLVRNTIPLSDTQDLDDNTQISLTRKIREAVLAIELERRYTKPEILEMYLNQINLGHNARGVEAAAQLYFGKSVADLDLAEAALLAALPKGPNTYSPYNNPELSLERRNLVLSTMLENGFIDQKQYDEAIAKPLQTVGMDQETGYPYPYFVDYVLENVIHELGMETVQSGGLRIYTTIDVKAQEAAERAMTEVLDPAFPMNPGESYPEAAIVLLENGTGEIKAMVGGRKHTAVLGLNRAWHKPWAPEDDITGLRQPGSAIKPLSVYLPALSSGFTAASVVDDVPKIYSSGGTGQHVIENYDNRYTGLTTLREAVRRSINVASGRFLEKIDLDTAWNFAHRLGLSTLTNNDRDFSPLAVGGLTRGVSVLNMAEAYSTIANGGTRITPYAVTEIRDASGKVIKSYQPQRQAVIDSKVAYLMTDILVSVVQPQGGAYNVNAGTGATARINGWQVAGKTGTTEQVRDAWFVGYTPIYTAAVWMGHDRPTPMGSSVCGGCYPAPMWRITMEAALEGKEPRTFEMPDGFVRRDISIKSGKLAGPDTPANMIRNELFIRGTEPGELDDIFQKTSVCEEDPDYLYESSCGCTEQEGVFLKRPPIAVADMIPVARAAGKANVEQWAQRFVPEDMSLAMPAESCRDARDSSWDAGSGNSAANVNGIYKVDLRVGRNRITPVWFSVPAQTELHMTFTGHDDDHTIVMEDEKMDPSSMEVHLKEDRDTTVELITLRSGVVTIRCLDHPSEVIRIIVGPADPAGPGDGSSTGDDQPDEDPPPGGDATQPEETDPPDEEDTNTDDDPEE